MRVAPHDSPVISAKSRKVARDLQIKLNGETVEVPERATLDHLIKQLALAPERLAIELNREVVRRADWPHALLADGDCVEIVHFVGGGDGNPRRLT